MKYIDFSEMMETFKLVEINGMYLNQSFVKNTHQEHELDPLEVYPV